LTRLGNARTTCDAYLPEQAETASEPIRSNPECSTIARAASAEPSIDDTAPPEQPRNQAIAPMPAALGSIADYENQDSEASSAAPLTSSAGAPIEHRGAQATVQNEAILGALVLGVIALELTAGNHHR
jgi:hypothetical protein